VQDNVPYFGSDLEKNVILYHCRDTRSLRALWAFEECGVAYELVKMPFPPRFGHEGYLDINSLGTVPAVQVDDYVMTESAAICQYVAGISDRSDLRVDPGNTDYAAYLTWLHRSDATFTFPQTLVLRYSRLEPPDKRLPQVAADYTRWFLKRMEVVEAALADDDYLCAERFTMADVCVGYALYLADRLGISEGLGDRTKAYLSRLTARPAFKRALELQADMDPVV
jgi:glutathione S-transferase